MSAKYGGVQMKLNRYDQILKLIVDDFIETAQPVGSEALLSKHNLDCSSATIRNVMVRLEEDGYIEKTHTSSGRIPSKKGYAYYLQNLDVDETENDVSKEFEDNFKLILANKNKSIENVMEHSCKVLSEVTNLATVYLGPKASSEKLASMQLIRLSNQTVSIILVTDQGYVENKTFIIPNDINVENLNKCVELINQRVVGTSLDSLQEKITQIGPLLTKQLGKEANLIMEAFKEAVIMVAKNRVMSFGKDKLLTMPEYNQSKDDMQDIIKTMNDDEEIADKINNSKDLHGIKVNLSNEDDSKDIAVVSKNIGNDNSKGQIAVVGPKRMNYKKVIKALEAIGKILDEYFYVEGEDDEQ